MQKIRELECVDCGRPSEEYLCETCKSIKEEEKESTKYMSQIVSAELDPRNISKFILGGNATFTLHNTLKGTHLTYKVRICEDDNNLFFVSVLTGPDNWINYKFIGSIRGEKFYFSKKSKISPDSPSVVAFTWFWSNLHRLPPALKVLHEGKCGRCGRKLTVPESIESGFGPECIKFVGG
jgi:Family of unknown function (DUF6011)